LPKRSRIFGRINMNNPKAWIKAARLRTLPLSFSNIILGTVLAISTIESSMSLHYCLIGSIFILTIITTLLLQVLSNFANDYGDSKRGTDNEDRLGPDRSLQSGEISEKAMLRGIMLVGTLALTSGVLLILWSYGHARISLIEMYVFFGIGILSIAAAINYTIGKKAYGYSGFGDLFVFIFFGIVGVFGTYYLQVRNVNLLVLLPASTMGLFSVAVLNLNNMRDHENDKRFNKRTLVVRMGMRNAKIYHTMLFVVAYLCILISYFNDIKAVWQMLVILSPVAFYHLVHLIKVWSVKKPKDFDPELKKVAVSAFLFSLLYAAAILSSIKIN
jgi:1,4-dihydroxy-2-naphthoate polyprenyltransferase